MEKHDNIIKLSERTGTKNPSRELKNWIQIMSESSRGNKKFFKKVLDKTSKIV